MFENIPPEVQQAAPGAIGSFLALRWLPGPWLVRLMMFIGGCAVAWYGTSPLANALEVSQSAHGLVGLLLGFCSMGIAGKIYSGFEAIDMKEVLRRLGEILEAAIRRRL